jgi:hypothetical protein
MTSTRFLLSGSNDGSSALHRLYSIFTARCMSSEAVVGKFPVYRQGRLISITLCVQIAIHPILFITERGTDPPYYIVLYPMLLHTCTQRWCYGIHHQWPGNLPERHAHPRASLSLTNKTVNGVLRVWHACRWRYSGADILPSGLTSAIKKQETRLIRWKDFDST